MSSLRIITAGILAIPALLVTLLVMPVTAILSIPALCLLVFRNPNTAATAKSVEDIQVVVTGGSSGIGLEIAQECVKMGVKKVTIIARNKEKLEIARKKLNSTKTKVEALSVDVSSLDQLQKAAKDTMDSTISHSYIFCCAGEPHPEYFQKIPADSFSKLVNTNQLGSIFTAQAFLPHMSAGTIVFTSSMAGQIGVFGYTAYAPTKFAIRGFAECLHAELCHTNVRVQVAYPPDTDTPGFEKENSSKPEETRLISEQGGLAKPHEVAKTMVRSAMQANPPFSVYFSFDGWMLTALTCGFDPVMSVADALSQVVGMTFFRWISLFYLQDWYRIIQQYARKTAAATPVPSKED